jgi:DNA-binding transcriptional regulator YiaG
MLCHLASNPTQASVGTGMARLYLEAMLVPNRQQDAVLVLVEARTAARSGRAAQLRRAAGLSQAELAAAVGVTPSCVCRWEAGGRRPSGEVARAYVRALRLIASTLPSTSETSAANAGLTKLAGAGDGHATG